MTDETIKCQLSRRVCGIGCPEFFILTNDKDVPLTKEQLEQVCHSSNSYSDLRAQLERLVDVVDGEYSEWLKRGKVKDQLTASHELLKGLG